MKVLANGLTFLKLTSSTPSYSPPFWFYPCQFQRQYWWHRRQAFRRDRSAWKLACVAWRLVQDTRDTRDHGRPLAIAISFACLSYHVFRFVSAKSRCEEVIWAWKSFQFQRPFDIKIKAKKLRPKKKFPVLWFKLYRRSHAVRLNPMLSTFFYLQFYSL